MVLIGLLKPIIVYKDKLMELLLTSQDVVDLINDKEYTQAPALGLAYKKVFPYAFIPQTLDVASCIVCFEANVSEVKTDAICDIELNVLVLAHTGVMRTDRGTRIDVLADTIDDLINHSRDFGIGLVTPADRYPTEYSIPNYDYVCRKLLYDIRDFNYRKVKP